MNEIFSGSTPALSQDALDLSLEEFSNYPSITPISSQNINLAFSFQPVGVEYIGKLLSELKINNHVTLITSRLKYSNYSRLQLKNL